jgi:hypothetical protein
MDTFKLIYIIILTTQLIVLVNDILQYYNMWLVERTQKLHGLTNE